MYKKQDEYLKLESSEKLWILQMDEFAVYWEGKLLKGQRLDHAIDNKYGASARYEEGYEQNG